MNVFIWSQSDGSTNNKAIVDVIRKNHEEKGDAVYTLVAEKAEYDASSIASYQAELKKADLVYLAYPIQWGTYPHEFKKTLDTILQYGFAYEYNEQGKVALLTNKEGKVVTTSGHPNEYYVQQLESIHYIAQETVLNFVGITPKGALNVGGRSHGKADGLDLTQVKAFISG